jgi:hypothetical protein
MLYFFMSIPGQFYPQWWTAGVCFGSCSDSTLRKASLCGVVLIGGEAERDASKNSFMYFNFGNRFAATSPTVLRYNGDNEAKQRLGRRLAHRPRCKLGFPLS